MKRSLLLAAALMAIAGCSSGPTQSAAGTSSPATTTTASSTPSAAVTIAVTTDETVCLSLEKTGHGFYPTYASIMKKQPVSIQPIELSAQMAVLSTTGAVEGSIDGAGAINQASPDLRLKLSTMVRDATQTAQRFADAATGAVAGSDITPIVNSFTSALVACTKAGYQPSWFDPAALTG